MTDSKLSIFCNRIIEASWLAVVILTPLFFDPYSRGVIEPDKLALLRSFALVMLAAWAMQWFERRNATSHALGVWLRAPLVLPILILSAIYTLSTCISITPAVSFFGSYWRAQGLDALLACIVVCGMIVQGLKTRAQINRLIAALLFASFPIALYAILQKFNLDPLLWSNATRDRVASTLGNPIFLAAYLIMVGMLVLGKIASSLDTFRREHQRTALWQTLGYVLILGAQFSAIVFSGSRGPFLGWLTGVALLIELMLLFRQRALTLSLLGLGLLSTAFIIVPNFSVSTFAEASLAPATPVSVSTFAEASLAPATPVSVSNAFTPNMATPLARLGDFSASGEAGNNLAGRIAIWEGSARLIQSHAPLQFPDGSLDTFKPVRLWLGYGLDTLPYISKQIFPAAIIARDQEVLMTSTHNATWEIIANAGVLGLLAEQFLLWSIFSFGIGALGWMPTPQARNLFAGLWLGLGVASMLVVLASGQEKFLGIALPASNCASLALYLAWRGWCAGTNQLLAVRRSDAFLLAAVLAGIMAHYIESQMGLTLATTRLIFWVFVALALVLGTKKLDAVETASVPVVTCRNLSVWLGGAAVYAFLLTLILVTQLFGFIAYDKNVTEPLVLLWRVFSFNPIMNAESYAILALLTTTWLGLTLLSVMELASGSEFISARMIVQALAFIAVLSLVLAFGFGVGLASQLVLLPSVPIATTGVTEVLAFAMHAVGFVNYYILALAVLTGAEAFALWFAVPQRSAVWATRRLTWVASAAIVIAAGLAINVLNLNPIRADVIFRLGQMYHYQADWNVALPLYQNVLSLAPMQDMYYNALGGVGVEHAHFAVETPPRLNSETALDNFLKLPPARIADLGRLDLLYVAQSALFRARALNPLYPDFTLNLARFYLPALPVDTDGKRTLADLSAKYYAQAARLSPTNVILLNEWAKFDFEYRADSDAALEKLDRSLQLDAQFGETYDLLARVFAARQDWSRAAATYQRAVARAPRLPEAWSRLAFAFYQQEKLADAIAAYQQYLTLAPTARNAWEARKNLALLYERTGDLAAAVREAQASFESAPPEFKPQLSDLVARLRAAGKP